MIFALAENEPTMLIMLAEKDISTMRPGRSLFVDPRQLGNKTFNKVVISLHASNEAAIDLLEKVKGVTLDRNTMKIPEPNETEAVCDSCGGIMAFELLNHDRCIVCWRNLAIKSMGLNN